MEEVMNFFWLFLTEVLWKALNFQEQERFKCDHLQRAGVWDYGAVIWPDWSLSDHGQRAGK